MRRRQINLLTYGILVGAALLLGIAAVLWHPLYLAPPDHRWTIALYFLLTVVWLPVALIAGYFVESSSKKYLVIGFMIALICVPLTCTLSTYALLNIALEYCGFSTQANNRIIYFCRLSAAFEGAQYDMFDAQPDQPFMIYRGRVGR